MVSQKKMIVEKADSEKNASKTSIVVFLVVVLLLVAGTLSVLSIINQPAQKDFIPKTGNAAIAPKVTDAAIQVPISVGNYVPGQRLIQTRAGESRKDISDGQYAPGQLLIQFREPVKDNLALVTKELSTVCSVTKSEQVFPTVDTAPLSDIYLLNFDLSCDIQVLLKVAERMTGVIYAEPNYISYAVLTPDDPRYGEEWHLNNIGQTGGKPDADIDAPEAWDVETGTPPDVPVFPATPSCFVTRTCKKSLGSVVIAVIDSGFDLQHEDLADNYWVNPDEFPGNGLDDDDNGYVDDVNCWDFVYEDNDPAYEDLDEFHATHVAGIAAAVGNNAKGISGVSWSSKIMPCRALDGGSGTTEDISQAIVYATQNGADIISMSLGGYEPSSTEEDAIVYAYENDVLIVAAAGNDGKELSMFPLYPAVYDQVVAVAATTHEDKPAIFSNYGDAIDLSAPGKDILSAIPGNEYELHFGTSMSAPVVSGVAALVYSRGRKLGRDFTNQEVRCILESTADDVGIDPGWDPLYGFGRVNAMRAVTELNTSCPIKPPRNPPIVCGNRIVEEGEECDAPGEQGCNSSCMFTGNEDICRPVVQWENERRSSTVVGTPLVAQLTDDNGDGRFTMEDSPDVLVSYTGLGLPPSTLNGGVDLLAYNGDDGTVIFERSGSEVPVIVSTSPAIGDIDNDGVPDIVALGLSGSWNDYQTYPIVLEHDGSLKWVGDVVTEFLSNNLIFSNVGIADLNKDCTPEIYYKRYTWNNDGSFRWKGMPLFRDPLFATAGCGYQYEIACSSVAVDVMIDNPRLELLGGPTLYSDASGGNAIWENNDDTGYIVSDGFSAVVDIDRDGDPETVYGGFDNFFIRYFVTLIDGAKRGNAEQVIDNPFYMPYYKGNDGGSYGINAGLDPFAVGDVDGDGAPEIVVSDRFMLGVLDFIPNPDRLELKWKRKSIGNAKPVLFDFDGDGNLEIVSHDRKYWRILDGRTGFELYKEEFNSDFSVPSGFEPLGTPSIADIDNDGKTEILIGGRLPATVIGGESFGKITAYECQAPGPAARSIWNQGAYHVTNVNEDGSIPQNELPVWKITPNTALTQIPGSSDASDTSCSTCGGVGQVCCSGQCSLSLVCTSPRGYEGGVCACPDGATWNFEEKSCKCPEGTELDETGKMCLQKPLGR